MSFTLISAVLATSLLAASVRAETHTISFRNQCGYGTPYLIVGGQTVSTGEPYTSDGPISSSIAYLQTGDCEYNGENCMIIEMTLVNPTAPGTGSSSDISLIDPHTYNVQGSFSYYNGCPNTGANCASADCSTAFFYSDDTTVQVACEDNDVDLLIAFCVDATTVDVSSLTGSSGSSGSSGGAASSSSVAASAPSSTYVASSSYVASSTESAFSTSAAVLVATSSSAAPSSSSSSIAVSSSLANATSSAVAASNTAKCATRNAKRALRIARSNIPDAAELEPTPAAHNLRSTRRRHSRMEAAKRASGLLH